MICLCVGGCASEFREEFLGQSPIGAQVSGDPVISRHAPSWVTGDPQQSGDDVYFVGRGVGYNVLDERAAVNAARADVLAQIAQLMTTRVMTQSGDCDARGGGETAFPQSRAGVRPRWRDDNHGVRTLPGDELQQLLSHEAQQFTSAIAGDMVDRGVYLEKWDVREEPAGSWGRPSRGMIRYKCWLLMSIPREKLEHNVQEFRTLARDAYARFQKSWDVEFRWAEEARARSLAWADEDRKIRIDRENQDREWEHEMMAADRAEAEAIRRHLTKAHAGTLYRVTSTR